MSHKDGKRTEYLQKCAEVNENYLQSVVPATTDENVIVVRMVFQSKNSLYMSNERIITRK